jgi:hypothetical protein
MKFCVQAGLLRRSTVLSLRLVGLNSLQQPRVAVVRGRWQEGPPLQQRQRRITCCCAAPGGSPSMNGHSNGNGNGCPPAAFHGSTALELQHWLVGWIAGHARSAPPPRRSCTAAADAAC